MTDEKAIFFSSNSMPIELLNCYAKAVSFHHLNKHEFLNNITVENKTYNFCDLYRLCSSPINKPKCCSIYASLCSQMDSLFTFDTSESKFYLDLPKSKLLELDYEYFFENIKNLNEFLKSFFKKEVTAEKLLNEILLQNEIDSTYKKISELHISNPKVFSNIEMRRIYLKRYELAPEEYLKLITKTFNENKQVENKTNPDPRILLVGPIASEIMFDDTETEVIQGFFNVFSEANINISAEQWDVYNLYDFKLKDKSIDMGILLRHLAKKYFNKSVIMNKAKNDDFYTEIVNFVKKHSINGVVYTCQKFCDHYAYQIGRFEQRMKKDNIPVLRLEFGYDIRNLSQLAIRVETFKYMMEEVS